MIPKIGIIANVDKEARVDLHGAYGRSIEKSGGLPLVLPYVEEEGVMDAFVEACDGFLFSGGADVSPAYYGEPQKETCGAPQILRDKMELSVLKKVLQTKKPILGICRGIQLINVGMGGTLYQDIPTEYETDLRHVQVEECYAPSHSVSVEKDTPLARLVMKESMTGNSFHHQAIKDLAKDLCVMARAEDGIVEAVYAPDRPYLRAYQWHPERLYGTDGDNKLLFDDFINACKSGN